MSKLNSCLSLYVGVENQHDCNLVLPEIDPLLNNNFVPIYKLIQYEKVHLENCIKNLIEAIGNQSVYELLQGDTDNYLAKRKWTF